MGLFSDLSGIGKGKGLSDRTRYVDDFKVVEVPDKNGRLKKRAVYTGTWFTPRDEDAAKRRLWAALALAAVEALLYLWTLMLTHLGSGKLLVMLPLLAGLFPLWYLLMGIAALPYRGKPMRRDQYMHSFIRVSRSAVAVAAFAAVGLAAVFVYRTVGSDWLFLRGDWLFLTGCVLVMGLSALLVILVQRIDIAERDNGAYESKPI